MQIDKIFHIADIHIRNYIRHQEYQTVFQRLYKYISENKTDNSIIFLGGDIAHSKNDVSPELFKMISNLLIECCNLCDTILITGNHDCNLNNQGRLDVLSPIVDAIKNPKLHYWKHSGIYNLDKYPEIVFNVFSVFDTPDKWTPFPKSSKNKTKIILHHGAVHGSKTDLNHDIDNQTVTVDIFKSSDYTLLGDIHKMQWLDENKRIAYCGSLCQQNFGETLDGHGLIEWDLKNKTSEFVPIENDYGYYTFYISNGVVQNPIPFYPKNLKVKIRHENTEKDVIVKLIKEIHGKCNVQEILQQKISKTNYGSNEVHAFELKDVRDIEYQNQLISEHLTAKFIELSTEDITTICSINREINSNLSTENTILRHVNWKPIRLEFSNMFSYGENNVIDFQTFKGNVGVFSANASGKSSLLSILTFCLFDKCEKTSKAIHVLNNNSDKFDVKLEIELKGRRYFIERSGVKNKKSTSVPVIVKFYCIDGNGNVEDLTGQQRDGTNKIIRDYFGTYDDFLLTSLSSQIGTQSFIDRTNKERKDLLYQFLDISIFANLFAICKDRIKEELVLVKELERRVDYTLLAESKNLLEGLQILSLEYADKIAELKKNIDSVDVEINNLYKKLTNDSENIRDIGIIVSDMELCGKQMTDCVSELSTYKEKLAELQDRLDEIVITESDREFKTIFTDNTQILMNEKSSLETKLSVLDTKIKHCNNSIDKLSTHEYDPNCQYCIKNPFVIDAEESKELVKEYLLQHSEVGNLVSDVDRKIQSAKAELERYRKISTKLLNKESIDYSIKTLRLKIDNVKGRGTALKTKYHVLVEEKFVAQKYEQNVVANSNILAEISSLSQSKSNLQVDVDDTNADLSTVDTRISLEQAKIARIEAEINRLLEVKNSVRLYEYYMKSVDKDGVSYTILTKVLPVIESEVNTILQHMVEFQIRLETTEDFYINAYIIYGEDKEWPIEMTSGMERFILTLALRTALLEVTSLPKPNFMAIDEGFGVLDNENMSSIYLMFEVLRTKFDFILSISHTDNLKDIMDNTLRIDKINGKSIIQLE